MYEDSGHLVPGRTQFDLPSRSERPYLVFDHVAYYDRKPQAVFKGPNRALYSLAPEKIRRAFQDEKEAALCGDQHFKLPYFQLALNSIKNSKVDRLIQRTVDEVEEKAVLGGAMLTMAGTAAYVIMAALGTGMNYLSNSDAEEAFRDTQPKAVASTTFAVHTGRKSASLGSPDNGEYWRFGTNGHAYCTVTKGKNPYTTYTRWASWLSTEYDHKCTPVEDLPAESREVRLYPQAYLAFLQVAKPQGNFTQARADEILDARRALVETQKRYNAIKP